MDKHEEYERKSTYNFASAIALGVLGFDFTAIAVKILIVANNAIYEQNKLERIISDFPNIIQFGLPVVAGGFMYYAGWKLGDPIRKFMEK